MSASTIGTPLRARYCVCFPLPKLRLAHDQFGVRLLASVGNDTCHSSNLGDRISPEKVAAYPLL